MKENPLYKLMQGLKRKKNSAEQEESADSVQWGRL
jgi:hypothetical protein